MTQDHNSKSLAEKLGLLSVNQLNAQIKLMEVWKALNVEDYPLVIKQQETSQTGAVTRAAENRRPIEIGKSSQSKNTCVSDAVRVWNLAPEEVKGTKSLFLAKKAIKDYVKSLPV